MEGATAPEGKVIQVKVQEAALRAGQGHKAALCVASPEVVVVPSGRVRRGAQEGSVFGVRASRHQVIIILGADDVVDVSWSGGAAGVWLRGRRLRLVLLLPAVADRDA